jgi:hypothetical protein
MPGSEGWLEHVDKTGTPCAYCGEPSTRTLELESDQWSAGFLKRRGKRVGLCDDCQPMLAEDSAAAVHFRRRGAKGVEQLAIDIGDQKNVGNAIFK